MNNTSKYEKIGLIHLLQNTQHDNLLKLIKLLID